MTAFNTILVQTTPSVVASYMFDISIEKSIFLFKIWFSIKRPFDLHSKLIHFFGDTFT